MPRQAGKKTGCGVMRPEVKHMLNIEMLDAGPYYYDYELQTSSHSKLMMIIHFIIIMCLAAADLCCAYPSSWAGQIELAEWLLDTVDGRWTEYHLHSELSGQYMWQPLAARQPAGYTELAAQHHISNFTLFPPSELNLTAVRCFVGIRETSCFSDYLYTNTRRRRTTRNIALTF